MNVVPPREAMPKSKAAAEQALATDGNLAQAHMSLAYASFTYDWDWPDATRHVDHAIALDREAVMNHFFYPFCLSVAGRSEEAVSVARRAKGSHACRCKYREKHLQEGWDRLGFTPCWIPCRRSTVISLKRALSLVFRVTNLAFLV